MIKPPGARPIIMNGENITKRILYAHSAEPLWPGRAEWIVRIAPEKRQSAGNDHGNRLRNMREKSGNAELQKGFARNAANAKPVPDECPARNVRINAQSVTGTGLLNGIWHNIGPITREG